MSIIPSRPPEQTACPTGAAEATLDEFQARVRSVKDRAQMAVSPAAALLDACAELGELAGAYLKGTGYMSVNTVIEPMDRLLAEYGDVLFALLTFANAAGVSAQDVLSATLARHERGQMSKLG